MDNRYWLLGLTTLTLGNAWAGGLQTLETVTVESNHHDLVGVANSASEGTVLSDQLALRPLLRPAEVLEVVPGLIVSQHSGSGKANQYYLRGFNLDHGTDFAASLIGMPLNMPTHGHGQGYLDLQFLIPELIDSVQYRKGALAADVGDFATAGSVAIDYKRSIDAPFLELGVGEDGYRRGLAIGSTRVGDGDLLHAFEWTETNGPWVLDEDLIKRNAVLRYSQGTRDNGWSVSGLAYSSSWQATDQVPRRAINSGQIDRFGFIDPTVGGRTHRYSISAEWAQRSANQQRRASVYAVDYKLNLFSNFTLFLNDPVNGDQFEQLDDRRVYGGAFSNTWFGELAGLPSEFTIGTQIRHDAIDAVGLFTSTARQRTGTIRLDEVDETSVALYAEHQLQWHPKFRSVLGLRTDAYRFDVNSNRDINSGRVNDHITSPKAALIFGPWAKTEFYAQAGYGFHSNDARGVTTRLNPDFRDPGFLSPSQPADPLVRAKSYELGLRTGIIRGLQSSLAFWRLDLDSELLFIGDAGTTEPSFPSRREGIEFANFWQPNERLTVDADLAYSRARFQEGPSNERFIPGSVEKTASVGVAWQMAERWHSGLRLRYFGPRPLIEDNSVRSASSTLVNARLAYDITPKLKLTGDLLNVFDRQVSDIDYFYESQLQGEAAPVEDIHTHPAEPRTLRMSLRWSY